MKRPIAGLIPLFAGLYDQLNPRQKDSFNPFIDEITSSLTESGLDIIRMNTCIYKNDIDQAVKEIENSGACAIILLFLTYHPSLESADALTQTGLPVIMLDTTLSFDFNAQTDPAMVSSCHGIHGVQDLSCVLRRLGKDYTICAGHYRESDVIARTAREIKACWLASQFRACRVGQIGAPFAGMGDFQLDDATLHKLTGIQVVRSDRQLMQSIVQSISAEELSAQIDRIGQAVQIREDVGPDLVQDAALSVLAVSKWIETKNLQAFSFNFLAFNDPLGLPTIPFLAASLLMQQGIGYAGEGDVLTAALVHTLSRIYPDSTFTEMFCPDWQDSRIFLSHMSEANLSILCHPNLVRKKVGYVSGMSQGLFPGVAGYYRAGEAVLVNLAPGPDNQFSLILVPCTIEEPVGEDRFAATIHGWLKPPAPLDEFLEAYSDKGGTHHSCLCYGADIKVLQAFGHSMNWPVSVLDSANSRRL